MTESNTNPEGSAPGAAHDSTRTRTAAPTPGPVSSARPRPVPGPKPAPRPSDHHDHPKPAAPKSADHPHGAASHLCVEDPAKYGRVDEDGSVWLKTPEGERKIGEWQAGEAVEGLAHFGRRYDDLATEVELLEIRLHSGAGDARKTRSAAIGLLESLPDAAVLGDIEALSQRLNNIVEGSAQAAEDARLEREKARSASIARKEALAAEAEQIGAESTQWKAAGDRLREILDEWKAIRGIDRKTDDVLWKRYSKAREAFNRRRGAHFAELDRERAGAKARKEELVVRAEELASSTDWGPTAGEFRELMSQWKVAGRAPRDTDDALWKRFKAAQDTFFGARNAANHERDIEFEANARAKEALLQDARSIDPSADLDAARAALRTLQEKWDEIGKVPRQRIHDLEAKLREIEHRVRDAADSQWRRTDPEALARAAQFRERVGQFEEQAAKASAAGKSRDAERALEQARQWREWAEAAEGAVEER